MHEAWMCAVLVGLASCSCATFSSGAAIADVIHSTGPVDMATYKPSPVDVGWQVYVGFAVGVFPFIIGAYEFGKRILIQRR
jgi:hypothetical protein